MKKPSKDINEIAFNTVQQATDPDALTKGQISQFMAHMGRKGGLKGGKARAASLSPEKRSEIARKAAQSRWKSKK